MAERRTRRDRIAIESVFGPEGEAARCIRLEALMAGVERTVQAVGPSKPG